MTAVRLALIGAGLIGARHLKTIAKVEEAELVAIADANPAAAASAQSYEAEFFSDTREMLAKVRPEGVIIATPTDRHLAPAVAALETGAHLLIEKPITTTLEDAAVLIEKSRAAGREVLVGHHRRYYPFVHEAREILQKGELGQVVAVNGQWTLRKPDRYFDATWRQKPAAGPILINFSHEIDSLRYICGEIVSLSAELASTVRGHEKEETAAILLRFENGALGTFLLSDSAASPWAWEYGFPENPAVPPAGQNACRFVGDRASLEFPNLKLWRHENTAEGWHSPLQSEDRSCAAGDAYVNQCRHFCRVIRGQEAPRITAEDATRSLRATLAVFEAAESGRRVLF